MIEKDTYNTIEKSTKPILYKYKNSKFYGYAYPILSESVVKSHIDELKKEHHSARHWCYAYQIGTEQENIIYRANDDGEPNNSAGLPIYGQIQSFDITNILVVVVRYFGGVKLGVGGLISAYKTAAQMILDNSKIIEKTINIDFLISFDYKNINTIMRLIKEKKLNMVTQKLQISCEITISVRKKNSETIYNLFNNIFEIIIKKI